MHIAMIAPKPQRTDPFVVRASIDRISPTSASDHEVSAFAELSSLLLNAPQSALERFLKLALDLSHGGSAGISLLTTDATGEAVFRWQALAGAFAGYTGETVPGNFSLCRLCLDAGAPIVVSQPAGAFPYLAKFKPSIYKALIAPLYDNNRVPFGAMWIAWHDGTRVAVQDSTVIEQLAIQMVLAIKLATLQSQHGDALELIESFKLQQRKEAEKLPEASAGREIADQSEHSILTELKLKDAAMREMDHRAKNTLQIVANLLMLQSRSASCGEVRDALQEAYRRLLALARLHELLLLTNDDSREVPMAPLFASLADALRQSFGERSVKVELRTSVEEMTFPESVAIPLALLANELITNAYKHAFPNGQCGAIDLMLRRTSNDIILQVRDNGVGTLSIDDQGGLGHSLVRSFSAHLKGRMVYSKPTQGAGLVVTVTLPPPEHGNQQSALTQPRSTNPPQAANP